MQSIFVSGAALAAWEQRALEEYQIISKLLHYKQMHAALPLFLLNSSPLSLKSRRSDERCHSQTEEQIDLGTSYLISVGLNCKKEVFVERLQSMHLCFLLFKYLYKLFKLVKKSTTVFLTQLPSISRIRFSALCSVTWYQKVAEWMLSWIKKPQVVTVLSRNKKSS